MAQATLRRAFDDLRAAALTFPQVHEDFPWGHSAFKVAKKKAFCFLVLEAGHLSMSCKLPASHHVALMLPFAEPTGYGLAKSGWVTARFTGAGTKPPVALLREWLAESYRAVAPKKVSRLLETTKNSAAPKPAESKKKRRP